MKGKKILKIFVIFICFMGVCFSLLALLIIFWGAHIFKKDYLGSYNPAALVNEGQWKQDIHETNNFAKWITIDEIPASEVKAIALVNYYYIHGCKSCKEAMAIDINDVERFEVIGEPTEVWRIIGRTIPSDWAIGDSCDMKKIMNDFRNATRCKEIVPKLSDGILSTFLAYVPILGGNRFEVSVAWDFYNIILHGSSVKDVYWEFPADGYAIFITESREYALKYGIDESTIYGPDYYSSRLRKDLASLYKNKNRSLESGRRKRIGEE
jgi:hypothetical protein